MATDGFRMEAIFSLQVFFPAVRMTQQDILRIYDGKYLFNKNKFYFKNLGFRANQSLLFLLNAASLEEKQQIPILQYLV